MSFVTVSMKPAPANGTVRHEIERLLQDVLPMPQGPSIQPVAQAREDATGFVIELDVPGVSADQIEVMAEDGVLKIKGQRSAGAHKEGEKLLFNERGSGAFERHFRLPKSADVANVQADYANGVLVLRIGKLASLAPRRVTVNVNPSANK